MSFLQEVGVELIGAIFLEEKVIGDENQGSSFLPMTQTCGYSVAGNTDKMRQRSMSTKEWLWKPPTAGPQKTQPTTQEHPMSLLFIC